MVAGCTAKQQRRLANQNTDADSCSLTDYLIETLDLTPPKNQYHPPPPLNSTDKRGASLKGMINSCHPAILRPFTLKRCLKDNAYIQGVLEPLP
eukprot:Protomagalhaensia_wolfi_Nauph_80__5344@NODE_5804_length_337_cov_5_848993_g4852_i0_p1_GENE_NODE_5804_length_337_cov_5_848993_g4852_i0NODE_5804_length_337_cov_5_848993_g4852_i0_p1_ORF_typecomplete_len106_score24_99_NODE_5804_length_337_cov_5_848993_g4852_i039320